MLALATLAPACGLLGVGRADFDFRTYEIRGLPHERAVPVVIEGTRRYLTQAYNGVALGWDPETGNLRSDPIYSSDGRRMLRLYMSLRPAADPSQGTDVEMLALVRTLESTSGAPTWTEPKMDVILERELYAWLVEAAVYVAGESSPDAAPAQDG